MNSNMNSNSNVVAVPFRRGLVARIIERVSTWNERRIAVRQLSLMSDRMLRDIGIDRSEIIRAVNRPAEYARLETQRNAAVVESQKIERAA